MIEMQRTDRSGRLETHGCIQAGAGTPVMGAGASSQASRLAMVAPAADTSTPTHTDSRSVGNRLVVMATRSSAKTSKL